MNFAYCQIFTCNSSMHMKKNFHFPHSGFWYTHLLFNRTVTASYSDWCFIIALLIMYSLSRYPLPSSLNTPAFLTVDWFSSHNQPRIIQTIIKFYIVVIWIMTTCSLVIGYEHLRETCRLYHSTLKKWRLHVLPKC